MATLLPLSSGGFRHEISTSFRQLIHKLSLNAHLRVPLYVWCTLFTALGGFLWGFDTGSIGPITEMEQFHEMFGKLSVWTQGFLVASILITASVTSFMAGPISDRISRTFTISLGGLIFALGAVLTTSSKGLPQFFVGRCISGVGEGLFTSSITVYVTEISPASSRGRLATMFTLFNVTGIMTGYFTCYGTVHISGSFAWRFPCALPAGVGIILGIITPFLPHSPRWLAHAERYEDAEAAKIKLGLKSRATAADPEVIEPSPDSASHVSRQSSRNIFSQFGDLWKEDVRTNTILGIFIMSIQQLSGIDAVLYYAPTLFKQAGLSSSTATFLASGVSGILMVVLTFASQWGQDKWSRRSQMIGGGLVIGGSMTLIGTLYASHATDKKAGQYAVIGLIYLFVAGFVSSWAIVCRIVCSEVQPTRTRAAGSSLSQCANWMVNCIIAITTPAFLASSGSAPYFFFGGCSVFGSLVCLAFQPETRGLDLEVIDKGVEDTPIQKILRKRMGLRMRRQVVDETELNVIVQATGLQ